MKISSWSLIRLIFFLFLSCAREETILIDTDFKIFMTEDSYSVPAELHIINKTTGADTFEWFFQGTSIENSHEKNPAPLTYLKAGNYEIKLLASNRDGEVREKIMNIKIDDFLKADFQWELKGSDIAPARLEIKDTSSGAQQYRWDFSGGEASIVEENNPVLLFDRGGEYRVKLVVFNGQKSDSLERKINIKDPMRVDFDWSVEAIDSDYEAPVRLYLRNLSSNASSYKWRVQGAIPSESSEKNPIISLPRAGLYSLSLTGENDKESKTIEKELRVHPDKNILSFTDLKLGINTAHKTIGSFFSSTLGKVLSEREVNTTTGPLIDLVFFGMSDSFQTNFFIAPDKAETTRIFKKIPGSKHTIVINRTELFPELVFGVEDFDAADTGEKLAQIVLEEKPNARIPFDDTTLHRIVLFQTEDGRKGALKIKAFSKHARDSYILVDLKIQKNPIP